MRTAKIGPDLRLFSRLCGALGKSGEHTISYSCFFRALQTARVHPIARYTLPKHKPTLIIEKKKMIPVKSQETPEKGSRTVSPNPSHARPEGKQTA